MALDLNNLPKSRHYCRKANAKKGGDAQFHLDWTKGKVDEYKDKFNTDFRLIFYRDQHPFDYYSIPYKIIEENITESHLDERKRWHGYIEKNILKVTRKSYEMVRIDVSQYKNHHDEPERTWLVLQKPQSIYDDIEGECYEYPETIANGKNISEGDYLICVLTKKKSKGGKRIIGIGKIGNIEKNGKDRKAHYEWYRNFTVPQTFEFIGGDPRNNKINSINSIPVEQAPEILSRLLGDFPEKEKPSTRRQFPPGLPKDGETLFKRSNSKEGYLYVVTNPQWPSWVKIGITRNLRERLASYNTGTPTDEFAFKVEYNKYHKDARRIEYEIHRDMVNSPLRGDRTEWYKMSVEDACDVINNHCE